MADTARPPPRSLPWMAFALALAGAAFSLHAHYPGHINPDSFQQLRQILDGRLEDWHSPFMAMVWSQLLEFLPGPVGFIVLVNGLVWGSLAMLATAVGRRCGMPALLLVALPLLPGVSNYLGNVHKDALLVAWLLSACCAAFLAGRQRPALSARLAQAAANVLLLAAFLTRPNAIFALLPLLLYANRRLRPRGMVLATLAATLSMPVVMTLQNRLLEVKPMHGGDSIKTFHLLALSYFEGRNLFPGAWSEEQSDRIVNACYTPVQWDNASRWGKCGFIYHSLERQGLWGSSELTKRWLGELARHPLEAYSAMAATFRKSVRNPNSRVMLYRSSTSERINWVIQTDPPRLSTRLARRYLHGRFNDLLGRPWLFAMVSALAVAWLFGARLLALAEGRLALAVLCSGMLYQSSYFATTVSAEARYFYWSAVAAWLGMALTALAALARRRGTLPAMAPEPGLRLAVALLTGLSVGLVAGPFKLPTERRTVHIEVLGAAPITVTKLRTASIPNWMAIGLEGRVEAPGWRRDGPAYSADGRAGVLTATITTLLQDLELEYRTGPGLGRMRVTTEGFDHVIDTAAPQAGTQRRLLPPPPGSSGRRRHASPAAALKVAAWLIVVGGAVMLLGGASSGRRRRPRTSASGSPEPWRAVPARGGST